MDISLSFTETGAGFPLILLHGNGETRAYFEAQIQAFSASHRVFAVDTRGHGTSPRGSAPFRLTQFALDLAAFMEEHHLLRADILGFSDGGNIALLFALRNPQRVRRLVLNGANLYPTGMLCGVWACIWFVYLSMSLTALFFPADSFRRDLYRLMAREPHIRVSSLGKIDAPTLVIAGTQDMVRERHTRRITKALPDGRLCLLQGGHAIAQEQPEGFNQEVLRFLAEEN